MSVAAFVLTCCGLAVVLLGGLWRFSSALGKNTQLLETVASDVKSLRSEMKEEVETVHRRVDKLGEKVDRTSERQVWMLGKMGINDEGVTQ